MGITVHEFALMGPTIFHFEKGGTKYALRLFPIGGFVSMEGEDSESEDEGAFAKTGMEADYRGGCRRGYECSAGDL